MLTFKQLGKYGRLGNQLFQYAALKAAALRNGYECKIPDPNKQNWHGQQCMLNSFNIESSYLLQEDLKYISGQISDSSVLTGTYVPILNNISDNINLHGFFQNTKYFEDFSHQIIKELTPKKELLEKGLHRINKIKRNKKLVSLHIRRGDQTDGTNPEYIQHYGTGPFDIDSTVGRYIVKSLSFFQDCDILVFTGGSRSANDIDEINWAKKYFSDKKFIVSETNNALQDFILMSLCDHNIISFASSFGWWAAYINSNSDKIVIAPEDYHLDKKYTLREGFYPKEWKLL